jgi:tetratricopeptide (TPR) repeat protein
MIGAMAITSSRILLTAIILGCCVQSPAQAQDTADVSRLIARGHAPGWAYAQRGFARRKADSLQGAVQDFDAALGKGDLDAKSVPDIRYARVEAAATLAEREGQPQMAEASYRELLQTEPAQADAWYKLGYLLLKQKRRQPGADALTKGLEIRPVATAYLDAANAYILSNAPLASKQYRQGLDRWYAGDASIAGRPPTDLERIKNEVVQADATVQTSVSLGGIYGRPNTAGGSNNAGGAETRVRFDGRYLPAITGLEAFARGLSDKDANGERETDAGAGLRYRPIADLNFYVGGLVDHFFQPKSETEFVATWGLGLGADAYPYVTGWKPYWDFGTFGSWRTADKRVLEDVHGNAGVLYEFRAPLRGAIGPTLLAVAGYDNQATTQWATGVGPSLLSYIWLGGDKYRSYDSIVTLQVGYLFNIGRDQRQRGWRGQISVTF